MTKVRAIKEGKAYAGMTMTPERVLIAQMVELLEKRPRERRHKAGSCGACRPVKGL
jgi:hypothetical protein